MSESTNDNSFKPSVASDMDADPCEVPLPTNAPSSSASSDGRSQATAINFLVTALKSDLQLDFAMRLGDEDAVRGIIERHLDAVAIGDLEWLQELKSRGYESRDIAELLVNKIPWIYSSQPPLQDTAILPEFHVSNCIHQGAKKADLAPKLILAPSQNNEDMRTFISEHCGLAGVVPDFRNIEDWTGVVAFSGKNRDTAWISYRIPGFHYQLMGRAHVALRRFCRTASYLQKESRCCNSFTVLRYASFDGSTAIELRHVELRLASDLLKELELALDGLKTPELVSRCLPLLTRRANDVIRIVCDDHTFTTDDVMDFWVCVDRVSLATQILTLGLYLYSQAHTGSVHPSCLTDPLEHIYLFGSHGPVQDSTLAHVQVSLFSLTCVDGVTGDRVAVFGSCHDSDLQSSDKSYDLLATPKGLAETWDVLSFITDGRPLHGEGICAIELERGFIIWTGEVQHLGITVPKLHWKSELGDRGTTTPFSLRSKVLFTGGPARIREQIR